jgi:hypothetical protein
MDDLADDPADRAFGFARLKASWAFGRPGFNASRRSGRVRGSGFQIHLKFVFRSKRGISVC